MPRVLTVDDSKALRMMVKKHLKKLELEIEEAEDGVKGLEKLEAGGFDLVLLDVTMPNMDGPTMLTEMRKRGDKTKVLMLTAESSTSVIGEAMKQGIDGYILKPFKPAEVRGKVSQALGIQPEGAEAGADILLVEDLERVAAKLRQILPTTVTMVHRSDGERATEAARRGKFRVILLSSSLEGADLSKLASQFKLMQPDAALLLFTPKADGILTEARKIGFSDVFFKPFNEDSVMTLVRSHVPERLREAGARVGGGADNDSGAPVLNGKEDVLELLSKHKDEVMLRYFTRAWEAIDEQLQRCATECRQQVFLDLSKSPGDPEREMRLVAQAVSAARKRDLELYLVGTDRLRRVLQQSAETRDVQVYGSIESARSAVAA